MYLHHLTLTSLLILFFVFGFAISSQIIAYPLVAESNPAILTGEAEGLASVLIMAGGFAIPVFPALLNIDWHHTFSHHIPLYSSASYHLAFMIMPIAFIIAFFAACLLKETKCLSLEEQEKLSNDAQPASLAKEFKNVSSPTLSR